MNIVQIGLNVPETDELPRVAVGGAMKIFACVWSAFVIGLVVPVPARMILSLARPTFVFAHDTYLSPQSGRLKNEFNVGLRLVRSTGSHRDVAGSLEAALLFLAIILGGVLAASFTRLGSLAL